MPNRIASSHRLLSLLMMAALLVVACNRRESGADSRTPLPPSQNCTNEFEVTDVALSDGAIVDPTVPLVQTWQITNTGTCTWDASYRLSQLTHSDGVAVEPATQPLLITAPGESMELSVTLTVVPSTTAMQGVDVDFRMLDPYGKGFGPELTVTVGFDGAITAAPPIPTPTTCLNAAEFVIDVTIPPETIVVPGEPFVKTWRVLNSGTCAWDATYWLAQQSGGFMIADPPAVQLPPTAPGETADVSMTVTLLPAALSGGMTRAQFALQAPDETTFGDPLVIIVTRE